MGKVLNKGDIKDYIMIIIGTTFLAAGINIFIQPNQMVIGGITGLGIVIEYVTAKFFGKGIPLSVTNIVINIPLFILAIKLKGKNFAGKAIFAVIYLSVALWYTGYLPVLNVQLILVSIFGGALVGLGIGLVLKASASTGGTDLVATIIKHLSPRISLARVMACIDSAIILLGVLVFGIEKGLFALVAVFISSTVVDRIVSGGNACKSVHIISEKSEEISLALMKQLNRGVTGFRGMGMYTHEEKCILYVVCDKKEIVDLQNLVKEIDDKAFLTITDVMEVYGRGFTEPKLIQ